MAMPHRAVVMGIRTMFSNPDRLAPTWYDAAADEHRRVMKDYRHRRAFFACLKQIYMEEAFEGVDRKDIEKIVHGNAARIYHLD